MKYYEYSEDTKLLAARYNIDNKDVMFCRLLAAGADRADSYAAIYHTSQQRQNTDQTRANANELLKQRPGLTLLIRQLKQGKPHARIEDEDREKTKGEEKENSEGDDLTTRAGMLARLQQISKSLAGKDELSALQLLAKMQGLDKPDEQETAEKRVYFLPWVSNCRTCELMRVYINNVRTREK